MFLSDKISNKETSSNISLPMLTNDLGCNPIPTPHSVSSPSSGSQPVHTLTPQAPITATTPVSTSSQLSNPSLKRKSSQPSGSGKYAKSDEMSNKLDILTLKLLEKSECSPTSASRDESAEDDNLLFFKSLLPSMRAMSKRKNRQARQEIQDIIFQLELSDEDY